MRLLPNFGFTALLTVVGLSTSALSQMDVARSVYHVDCNFPSTTIAAETDRTKTLHSLEEVNNVLLKTNDTVLFRRGTVCKGSLQPKGNGFSIGAYGDGALPRIEAGASDEAALLLSNQEGITVSSLEFVGGTTYGVRITGDKGTIHAITLSNITVRDVRGPLKKKASGLVVIGPTSAAATFSDLLLDGVRAYDTTQWSGIFVAGGSQGNPANNVTIRNSMVHDVQGDGIVLFSARDSSIQHSLAWHTGMQHQQSIGTPNGIWTWQCTRCEVSDSEAFLTDSPGVDGGAFDIDWGNTQNTVQRNYGHDTQGYCVSIFAANGPTTHSVVDRNVCINNGQSPRLAQREGAILLMTWNGGAIHGLTVSNNFVDWHPAGNTPAIQAGSKLTADEIVMSNNQIQTEAAPAIDPAIRYTTVRGEDVDHTSDQEPFVQAPFESTPPSKKQRTANPAWRLVATRGEALGESPDASLGALLVDLTSSASEYPRSSLQVELDAPSATLATARDWELANIGVSLNARSGSGLSMNLISPAGEVVRSWTRPPSPSDLGPTLRRLVGIPDYGRLSFEKVRATD